MLHLYYLKIYGQMLNVVLNLLQVCSRSFSTMLCTHTALLYALLSAFCLGLASEKHQQPIKRWKRDRCVYSPGPLFARCRLAVATCLSTFAAQAWSSGLILQLQLFQDSDYYFPFPMWTSNISPMVVSLADLPKFCPHTTNSPFITKPNYQSGVYHLFPSRM